MKVFKLATGLAIGYVLGSRAGRDKYEQIAAAARKAQNHPAVTQVQQKAKQLLSSSSAAQATDTDTVPLAVTTSTSTTSASTDPAPRPPRRRAKSTVPIPDADTGPLT